MNTYPEYKPLSFKVMLRMYNNRQITENEFKRWWNERMAQQFDLGYVIGRETNSVASVSNGDAL